jgi:hypothetical protein
MKGKRDHAVPLTPVVRAPMGEKPQRPKAQPFVFSTTGGVGFSGFSKAKAALDKHIDERSKEDDRDPMPDWLSMICVGQQRP